MNGGKLRDNRLLQILLAGYSLFWMYMAIAPNNRFDWLLENLLIILFFVLFVVTYRFFQFSNLSYLLIAFFFVLHTYGAHYSYYTPVGTWLSETFDFHRDHYDRIVHFCFGLLMVHPIRELLLRIMMMKRGWSNLFSVIIVLAVSAFYELIEMWVALVAAPEIGVLFLGTQGDPWDAQHDIELAMYGSILTLALSAFVRWIADKRTATS